MGGEPERALALAKCLDGVEQSARIHMRIGLTYHEHMKYEQSQAAYAEGFRLWSQTVSEPEQHPPTTDRSLRMIWGLAPRNEEPTFDLIQDLFSGLVEETPDLEIVPDIAYHWGIEDGGRKYVFHLQNDVYWSDGEPVTAHDFAFAWRHHGMTVPALGKPLYEVKGGRALDYGISTDLQQIKVEIPDSHTLVVMLPRPAAYFLHLLSNPLAAPIPQHVVERHGDAWAIAKNIVSNGPYLLDRWDTDNDKMHFVRNPAYHGHVSGNVTRVEAYYFRQPSGWQHQLELYEQDLIDIVIIMNWGREGIMMARRRHPSEYGQHPLFTTFIYCFDTTRPPFDDVRVRQAFALTYDWAQSAASYGTELHKPTYGGFIPPGMPGHSVDIGLDYDPQRARQLLSEAGYPGGENFLKVKIARFYSPDAGEIDDYNIEQLRQYLGIPITHQILEWTAYWRHLAQESPHIMSMSGLPIYGDPDAIMRQSFCITQKLTGWRHPEYERLIAQAGSSQDQAERLQVYQQADTLLMQEAPLLPLAYQDSALLAKPWVRTMRMSPVAAGTFRKDVILDAKYLSALYCDLFQLQRAGLKRCKFPFCKGITMEWYYPTFHSAAKAPLSKLTPSAPSCCAHLTRFVRQHTCREVKLALA